jgi:hypothetical protein
MVWATFDCKMDFCITTLLCKKCLSMKEQRHVRQQSLASFWSHCCYIKLQLYPVNSVSCLRYSMVSFLWWPQHKVQTLLFIYLLFICAYNAWVISPPCPHPLPYHPSCPLPLPPQYSAETIFKVQTLV